ncbi:thiol protease aleurain-like [Nymphaea colorata]|nr:thiol protease aleurain-like [Nymphaea colorata]
MVRCSIASMLFFALLLASASARSLVDDAETHIHMVTDKLHDLDAHLLPILGHSRHAIEFARFAHRYGKRYASTKEIFHRFAVFTENFELIHSTNKKGLPYTLQVNQFADLSWEEFKTRHLGASQNCSATKGTHKLTDAILPESRDWRKSGIVSPVKNQGHCGSCWTFSTTGALEAAYAQATGKNVSLSEQQLVDCAQAFNNFGCHGGLPSQAFQYIKYNGGLDTEESYPYTGVDGHCKFSANDVGVKVANSVNITQGAEDELKHAVGVVRPVSVAFEVVSGFRFYKGGVYTSTTCGSSPMDVNHAVLAVGYGEKHGTPYWLIKNSWGKDWGVDGYFKMELGKNMCGIATCASYPIVDV